MSSCFDASMLRRFRSIAKGRFHRNVRLAFKIARAFGKQIAEVFIYDDI
jgi:DNA-binding XRE family transcriptional regulator